MPALRERRQDILELANYFLERHRATRPLRLSTAAAAALDEYEWPGNVRELERLIERAVALAESDVIQLDDLPPTVRGDYAAVLGPVLGAERHAARLGPPLRAPRPRPRATGNKREACRMLDISYHTLQAHLRYPIHDALSPWTTSEGAGSKAESAIEVVEA